MIEIAAKWARPDADGDMEAAWSAVVRALAGQWGTQKCALTVSGARVGDVVFHAVGAKAEALFQAPATVTLDVAVPGTVTGGVVFSLGAAGSANAPTAFPFGPLSAKKGDTIAVAATKDNWYKIELWFAEV